ncbi:MAG: hypothetical protein K9I74_07255 [Bacteroidales bacterium]|nr:hypothetical protein [Bacteroidales bacterium]
MADNKLQNITKEIDHILHSEEKEETKFNALYQYLTNTFGNKMYFCRIQGKRWAFLAGNDRMITPEQQVQLSAKYGILYDEPADKAQWSEMLQHLTQLLQRKESQV